MNEYEELHHWLDEQSEDDISTEEILQEYGLTMEKASERADLYKEKFFGLLQKYKICSDNISVMIAELNRLIYKNHNEELLFIYTALATEKGLLFGKMEDEEQALLYQISLCHDFLYKGRKSNFFLENINESVRKVNKSSELKAIKSYVYNAVLGLKHDLIMNRKNYSPI